MGFDSSSQLAQYWRHLRLLISVKHGGLRLIVYGKQLGVYLTVTLKMLIVRSTLQKARFRLFGFTFKTLAVNMNIASHKSYVNNTWLHGEKVDGIRPIQTYVFTAVTRPEKTFSALQFTEKLQVFPSGMIHWVFRLHYFINGLF